MVTARKSDAPSAALRWLMREVHRTFPTPDEQTEVLDGYVEVYDYVVSTQGRRAGEAFLQDCAAFLQDCRNGSNKWIEE